MSDADSLPPDPPKLEDGQLLISGAAPDDAWWSRWADQVQTVYIYGAPPEDSLDFLEPVMSTMLSLTVLQKYTDLSPLSRATSLIHLDVEGIRVKVPADLSAAPLREINATSSPALPEMLATIQPLESLRLERAKQADLDALTSAPWKAELLLGRDEWVIPELWSSTELRELELYLCPRVNLAGLAGSPTLRSISTDRVREIVGLRAISDMTALEYLDFVGLHRVDDPDALRNVKVIGLLTRVRHPFSPEFQADLLANRPDRDQWHFTGTYRPPPD